MSRPYPWTDEYVVAVADQILWNYQTIWQRLTDVDPAVSIGLMRELLVVARHRDAAATERLYGEVLRFRRAGTIAFVSPAGIPDYIFCTCEFPREYRGIPPDEEVPDDEIEILHMGDMPPTTYDWLHRGEVANFKRLLYLNLFNDALGQQPFGIDLASLPVLRALDLRENGLAELPVEVLTCKHLQFLDIRDNKFAALPDLSALASLQCLRLDLECLPAQVRTSVRAQLPTCEIM